MGRRQGKEGAGKGEGREGEWVGEGGKKRGKIKITDLKAYIRKYSLVYLMKHCNSMYIFHIASC